MTTTTDDRWDLDDDGPTEDASIRINRDHIEFLRERKIFFHASSSYDDGWLEPGMSYSVAKPCRLYPWSCQREGPTFSQLGCFSYSRTALPHGVSIGRYTAIGQNVEILGPPHPMERVAMCGFDYSTPAPYGRFQDHMGTRFPLNARDPADYYVNVRIGHDVWIGNDVKIQRNTTIGDGAVVANGTIVTKDVPPYTLVAGNPGRHKRLRFDPDLCDQLLEISWWNYAFTDFVDLPTDRPEEFVTGVRHLLDRGLLRKFSPQPIDLHAEFVRLA